MIRLMVFVLASLLCMAASATAQRPQQPPAQPQPTPPGAQAPRATEQPTDPLIVRLQQNADEEQRILSDLKKLIEKATIDVREADKVVDELLKRIQAQREEMRPDGPLSLKISELEGESRRLAEEAKADNDAVHAERFERSARAFQSVRERMNKAYSDTFAINRDLESRKRFLARSLRAQILEESSKEVEGAISQYEVMVQTRRGIAAAARDAQARPTVAQ